MMTLIKKLAFTHWYWWLMLLLAVALEAVALFYQYVLDYGPCPLCIHVRIGVMGFGLVSILALLLKNPYVWRLGHFFNVALMAWLSERSYILLGTERGFVYTECGINSGLPSWFQIDQWFPAVFMPLESCGYTPKLLFGITMAEALMVFYPLMLLLSLLMLGLSIFKSAEVD